MAYTKEIGIKDFYKYYKENEIKKGRKPRSYKIYAQLLKDINILLRNKIVYNGECFNLPYRNGILAVRKYKTFFTEYNKENWTVDYETSKKQGKTIYFESDYYYKWLWDKRYSNIRGKRFYQYKPCRKSKRCIADAIKNKGMDYFFKEKHIIKNNDYRLR